MRRQLVPLVLVFLTACEPLNGGDAALSPLTIETGTGAHVFQVETADAPEERARGLMFREELPPDRGMLFLYESERRVAFWMKDTYVSLDMIFMARDGTVLAIVENVPSRSLDVVSPEADIYAVLEVNAGTVARIGLQTGDRVRHAALGP